MDERGRPNVYSIPVHRSFADALANGLLQLHREEPLGLARALVLVPTNRARQSVIEAFVRRAEPALLLPRIVAIGDLGEDAPGVLFDAGADIPPAVAPLTRRFALARLVQAERARAAQPVDAAQAMRLATDMARTLDELGQAELPAAALALDLGDMAAHWEQSLALFRTVIDEWPRALERLGAIDQVERRNRLFSAAARSWAGAPPATRIVAAGITSSAVAVTRLLATIARLPGGMVVLPGLDLVMPDEEWDAIRGEDGGHGAIETHPQHQFVTLLDAIGVARSDVVPWRWGDGAAQRADRTRTVSNAFAPARFTEKWATLPATERRLTGVRAAEFATLAQEAQGIAIALRGVLETPGKTAALITPDRALAARVSAALRRWGIVADDSAGVALSQTPAGVLIGLIVDTAASQFAPVPLLALLKHPLVMPGAARAAWLEKARALDLALRGPRPAPGLAGVTAFLGEAGTRRRATAAEWWEEVAGLLAPLEESFADPAATLAAVLASVRDMVTALGGDAAWQGPAGEAAARLIEDTLAAAAHGPDTLDIAALPGLIRTLMGEVAVRPRQGGHNRIQILGLLEARMQSPDLVIAGSLNEGTWPAAPAPDPWLAPRLRSELGLGGLDRRVGLAAHDLALILGGREVLLTRARRDQRSPTVASRFWLRLEAMLGEIPSDTRLPLLADAIDRIDPVPPAARPQPAPPVEDRPKQISVTAVDRLKADPFAFYARAMLGLNKLDMVDADPNHAWRGTALHDVMERWAKVPNATLEQLLGMIDEMLSAPGINPVLRTLWQPRLEEAVRFVVRKLQEHAAKGRVPILFEKKGQATFGAVTLNGKADRIDRLAEGKLAIVDYKTGKPPSAKAVEAGFALQLGLLAAIAERGGFTDLPSKATQFEYWSFSKGKNGFGDIASRGEDDPAAFVATAIANFTEASDRWLTGDAPFIAKLNPAYAPYDEFDQLMRLQEWYGVAR